jgi:hypothetical protein
MKKIILLSGMVPMLYAPLQVSAKSVDYVNYGKDVWYAAARCRGTSPNEKCRLSAFNSYAPYCTTDWYIGFGYSLFSEDDAKERAKYACKKSYDGDMWTDVEFKTNNVEAKLVPAQSWVCLAGPTTVSPKNYPAGLYVGAAFNVSKREASNAVLRAYNSSYEVTEDKNLQRTSFDEIPSSKKGCYNITTDPDYSVNFRDTIIPDPHIIPFMPDDGRGVYGVLSSDVQPIWNKVTYSCVTSRNDPTSEGFNPQNDYRSLSSVDNNLADCTVIRDDNTGEIRFNFNSNFEFSGNYVAIKVEEIMRNGSTIAKYSNPIHFKSIAEVACPSVENLIYSANDKSITGKLRKLDGSRSYFTDRTGVDVVLKSTSGFIHDFLSVNRNQTQFIKATVGDDGMQQHVLRCSYKLPGLRDNLELETKFDPKLYSIAVAHDNWPKVDDSKKLINKYECSQDKVGACPIPISFFTNEYMNNK